MNTPPTPAAPPPSPPTPLEQLLQEMRAGFLKLGASVAQLDANVGLVSSEVGLVKQRLVLVEGRVIELDTWRNANSERVKGMATASTEVDAAHAKALADESAKRELLATKVDAIGAQQVTQLALLGKIEGYISKPLVRQVATAIGTALLTWLAVHNAPPAATPPQIAAPTSTTVPR